MENSTEYLVRYFGRVQGVGFRYTVREIVKTYSLKGYVKNCQDGTVELLIQGNQKEIERALQSIRLRWEGYIQKEEVHRRPTSKKWEGFEILFS